VNDPIQGLIYFVSFLILDGLLTATDQAFLHSHPKRLEEERARGRFGANQTIKLANEASQMIVAMRFSRGFLRLLTLGTALLLFSPVYTNGDGINILGFALSILAIGTIVGITEFLVGGIVLRSPDLWAVRLTYVASTAIILTRPFTWITAKLSRLFLGLDPGRKQPLVTEEEIMTLVDAGEEGGVIEEDEKAMIYSIFQLADTLAREVMTPRIDIVALDSETPLVEATDTMLIKGFSRAPVFSESIDHVKGLVYIKDLLGGWKKGRQDAAISEFMREAYFVPEGMKLDDLLAEMQVKRVHMAVVVDEYGGTAGLVTIEDIVEEVVGEIRDEYDTAEQASYEQLKDGEFLFSGGIDLDDVNVLVGSELPKDTSETLGGFIYSQLGRVATPGDSVDSGGLHLLVEQVTGRRISKVRAIRSPTTAPENHIDEN
jgi:CBS domain containing-hemolysin-like protein